MSAAFAARPLRRAALRSQISGLRLLATQSQTLPAIDRIRGPEGTRVSLSIRRAGASLVEDVTVERRAFRHADP